MIIEFHTNDQTHVFIIKTFFLIMFSTKTLKPTQAQYIIALTYLAKWVEKHAHEK